VIQEYTTCYPEHSKHFSLSSDWQSEDSAKNAADITEDMKKGQAK